MPGRRRSAGAFLAAFLATVLALAGLALGPAAADDVDRQALDRLADPPLGLPPLALERTPSEASIALGRKLFFDRRLSHNRTMSCGMCHVPEQGFTNNELARPIGVEGRSLRRSAPGLFNVAYQTSLFHDGRETALETQVISPLLAREEMANPSIGYLVAQIEALADYDGRFEAGPSIATIGQAIADWQRTLLSADSPFDRWYYGGQADALSEVQRRGFALFTGEAGCIACHPVGESGTLFTDQDFHDTGLLYLRGRETPSATVAVEIAPGVSVPLAREAVDSVGLPRQGDLGRHEVTLDPPDRWKLKTPSLRNVALTAPYMHDGSLPTLEAVVRFYVGGGVPHEGLDPAIQPLDLNEAEIAALVAFLQGLTGSNVEDLIADARSQAVGN